MSHPPSTPCGADGSSPSPAPGTRFPGWKWALGGGLVLVLVQLGFTLTISAWQDSLGLQEAYDRLYQWDSVWYGHIVEKGYRSTIPPVWQDRDQSNVAFLPGYPWLAKGVQHLLGLRVETALLLTAQVCAWGFWTYLLLFFLRWRASLPLIVVAVVTLLSQPAAYYLVAGYAESLFLMTLLGFLYWSDEPGTIAWPLAALHGFLMTATRVVGLPLAFYPLLRLFRHNGTAERRTFGQFMRRAIAPSLVCASAALGTGLFLLYCHVRFGHWNLYMQTQAIGWKVKPDYLGIFNLSYVPMYLPIPPRNGPLINIVSQVSVPLIVASFLTMFFLEYRVARAHAQTAFAERLGFYLCGGIIFYISSSSAMDHYLQSMVRYAFCVQVLLVLACVHLLCRLPPLKRGTCAVLIAALVVVNAIAFGLQIWAVSLFTRGSWVA